MALDWGLRSTYTNQNTGARYQNQGKEDIADMLSGHIQREKGITPEQVGKAERAIRDAVSRLATKGRQKVHEAPKGRETITLEIDPTDYTELAMMGLIGIAILIGIVVYYHFASE